MLCLLPFSWRCPACRCCRGWPGGTHSLTPPTHPSLHTPPAQGAIYLDGGLEAVRAVYLSHFPLPEDPLTLLQADGTGGGVPRAATASTSPWESD